MWLYASQSVLIRGFTGDVMSDAVRPIEVFYSYSHRDERLRDRLEEHLSILKNNGVITGWHDRKIPAGTKWEQQIDEHLNSADIILLLVSASFLASPYCYSIEMMRALERHAADEARVIPIILRSVDWKGAPFGHLQALPTDARPVTNWPDRERAFTNIAQGIRKVAEELRSKSLGGPAPPSGSVTAPPPAAVLSRVWTVPHPRNPNFTGREELLKKLRENLTSGRPAALTQAINGLGGVGKTQLATEYAYLYASSYDAVLWVRAEEPTTLAADFAGLATELGIPDPGTRDQNAVVKLVLRWLREHQGWLLVFDNAPGGWEISSYLPSGATGHVLITSRNRHWLEYAQPLVVDVMTPDEAIKFLLTRTNQTNEEAAGKLAEELGYLPLALAQAGAYIEQKDLSLAEYLPLVEKHGTKVLPATDRYPGSLAATWDLSFKEVRRNLPAAADLLNLCAFFAPDDIPLDMIVEGAEHLQESLKDAVADPISRNDIVGELGNFSLVEVDKDKRTISIHRLVQAVVRDMLPSEERQTWVAAALQVVNSGFTYRLTEMSTWSTSSIVLPHVLAVIASSDLQETSSMEVGRSLSNLLNAAGLFLRHRAQYKDARAQLARALAIDDAMYGPDHPTVATDLLNLGRVLQNLGDLQGARSHFERALAIHEAVYGPDHPNVATDLNDLGTILQDLGDLQGARTNLERALAIGEAVYGPDHPVTAVRLNNLGDLLRILGDLQGARSHFERALAIDEAVYGPVHPNVAVRLNNLGLVLQGIGDLQGARSHLERALAIDEAVYGPDHPDVATDLNNLGSLFLQHDNLYAAQTFLERSNKILRKYLGLEHPKTISTQKALKVIAELLERPYK